MRPQLSNSERIRFLVESAVIAALYAALTYFGNFFGLSYGPFQLRFSEILTVLPAYTPSAIAGLTVGCFLANLASFNPLDLLFGTGATLLAAVLSYLLRRFRVKNIPLLSLLPPIVINALIIGAELSLFWTSGNAEPLAFWLMAAEVAAGETAVCGFLGIPFCVFLNKTRLFGGFFHLKSK